MASLRCTSVFTRLTKCFYIDYQVQLKQPGYCIVMKEGQQGAKMQEK